MPKNILRDIMPHEKRTIRQVPLPRGRRDEPEETDEEIIVYEEESYEEPSATGVAWSRIFLWCAATIFLALLGFALATGFSGATVTVTPKTALIEVRHEFVALKGSDSKLSFQALPVSETAELSIPADTTRKVTSKASGKIVVYNMFSAKPQRLIKNTRFATTQGLIYRINESIVIPGFTKQGEKVLPGSIEATVFADVAGAEYNIGLSDFTVPGFKTDPARYATFYARSKTPITGGMDGLTKTPSDSALLEARTKLSGELDAKVRLRAKNSVPEGFVLYDQALILTRTSSGPDIKDSVAKVTETVTGTAYIFKRAELERAITSLTLRSQGDLPVSLPQLSTLHFEFNEKPSTDKVAESVRFKLSGGLRAISLYDKEKLRTALLGKQRAELASTMSGFPSIEKVDLVLRPFWSRSFPTDPKRVTIENVVLDSPMVSNKNVTEP